MRVEPVRLGARERAGRELAPGALLEDRPIAEARACSSPRFTAMPAPAIHSSIAPTRYATAGRPRACASMPTRPNGSGHSEGSATASDASIAPRSAALVSRPRHSTSTPPRAASARASRSSSSPSPATMRRGRSSAPSFASAPRSDRSPLRGVSRPANTSACARAQRRCDRERGVGQRRRRDGDAAARDPVRRAGRAHVLAGDEDAVGAARCGRAQLRARMRRNDDGRGPRTQPRTTAALRQAAPIGALHGASNCG